MILTEYLWTLLREGEGRKQFPFQTSVPVGREVGCESLSLNLSPKEETLASCLCGKYFYILIHFVNVRFSIC